MTSWGTWPQEYHKHMSHIIPSQQENLHPQVIWENQNQTRTQDSYTWVLFMVSLIIQWSYLYRACSIRAQSEKDPTRDKAVVTITETICKTKNIHDIDKMILR